MPQLALLRVDASHFDAASEPTPELLLVVAIVRQALNDLHNSRYRTEAAAFIDGDDCATFCDMLGWDVAKVRQAVAEGRRR